MIDLSSFTPMNWKHGHKLVDKYGISYNTKWNSWHVRGNNGYPVSFYPETDKDIEDVRRLFTKK